MARDLFDDWCSVDRAAVGRHSKHILKERSGERTPTLALLVPVVLCHYDDPQRISARIARLGYPKAARIIREQMPLGKRTRSGELGEILATEYVNRKLQYRIPIFRLRWKDGREMALRGDDLIGLRIEKGGLNLLKGEVKSRARLTSGVIDKASELLRRNSGRPNAHTMVFVMNRLEEQGNTKIARRLEESLAGSGIKPDQLCHYIFVFTGNDPGRHLDQYLRSYQGRIQQIVAGLVVEDHPDFIAEVYKRANAGISAGIVESLESLPDPRGARPTHGKRSS
jgi:hypothetical protein